jgi:ubiquinone/menaquinone biosynthesis C-methylase UbiE
MPRMAASESFQQQLASDFDRLAGRYDILQRFNPGYHGDLCRSAKRLALPERARILDLCCGTGLSTEALLACYPDANVSALDISSGMLAVARRKPQLRGVHFITGDAMDPAHSGAVGPYDAIFMAYGIRNVPDPDGCLVRLRELLAARGRIAFHEYSVAGSLVPKAMWNAVASAIIVPLGAALTGSGELFRYLRRSVNDFDSIERFEHRLSSAGFKNIRSERMPGWRRGIVHTVLAERG